MTRPGSTDGADDVERYAVTTLPVHFPWSYIRNRATGTALTQSCSGVEGREFEVGSLQQQWRAVCVGGSYFFLQNRASGFVLTHSWCGKVIDASDSNVSDHRSQWELRGACGKGYWALKNRGSGNVLDHFFGKSIQAYNDDELHHHHHWTIAPVENIAGSAHWEAEETDAKWCKAVQGAEGSASLALVVDHPWSYIFNRDSGKALAISEENVEAVDYEWGAEEQQWRAVKVEKGYHALQNRATGLVLDHYGGRRIGAYDNNFSNDHHRWQIKDVEGGSYTVLKNKKTGMMLDHYYWERIEALSSDEKNKAHHWKMVPASKMAREGLGPELPPETEKTAEELISLWERDSVPTGEMKGVYLVEGGSGKPRQGIRVVKSLFRRGCQCHQLQLCVQGLPYGSLFVPAGVEVGRERVRAALRRSVEGGGEVLVVDSLDVGRVSEVDKPLVNLGVFVGVAVE